MFNVVLSVEPESIAEQLGITTGDVLLSINEKEISDVFDYRMITRNEQLSLLFLSDNEEIEYEIEKDEDEDLGIIFEHGLMDEAKHCRNKCVFCFIDQLPKGMRETLYFKDDDMRLSFLTGNYVTLTNLDDEEFERLLSYHLSPVNISVHATDPKLREYMTNNKNAGLLIERLKLLVANRTELNFQIVLCRGINDGDALNRTIEDLTSFIPNARSLSVVPVGLTKYRAENKLTPLSSFDAESSAEVLSLITSWQNRMLKKHGTRFVYASDEFYVKSITTLPAFSEYEDFPQLENGVGMLTIMQHEFDEYLNKINKNRFAEPHVFSIATGCAAHAFISNLADKLINHIENLQINIFAIENVFFGKEITVSGLLTGNDIIKQLFLRRNSLGKTLFIPKNALKANESVFLDGITVEELSKALNIEVVAIECSGFDFIDKIIS